MLTRNAHSVSNAARMPEAMAEAAGSPGWPGKRISTDTCSGRAGTGAGRARQAPTSIPVHSHKGVRDRHRMAEHYSKGTDRKSYTTKVQWRRPSGLVEGRRER